MAAGVYVFSTGRLYVTPTGGSEVELAVLHTVTVRISAQKADLHAPFFVSQFPVAVGVFGRKANVSAENCAFNADAVAALVNGDAAADTDGSVTIPDTIPDVVAFPPLALRFAFQDSEGNPKTFLLPKVVAPDLALEFPMDNFMKGKTAFEGYPDASRVVARILNA